MFAAISIVVSMTNLAFEANIEAIKLAGLDLHQQPCPVRPPLAGEGSFDSAPGKAG
jgi:hypothetical protein